MLMALDTPLEGGGEGSKRKCWDFTGQKYVPMAKQGHVWMCFTEPLPLRPAIPLAADESVLEVYDLALRPRRTNLHRAAHAIRWLLRRHGNLDILPLADDVAGNPEVADGFV